eukprot:m.107523 g.107523  ORF g.107523 m.107523 type:complete len:165 (+) comp10624_c0_seq1:892-1386(+)
MTRCPIHSNCTVSLSHTLRADPCSCPLITLHDVRLPFQPILHHNNQCITTNPLLLYRFFLFFFSRYMAQAVAMVARGDATAPDVDTAMQLGAGHPMGPITLTDYVGLDVSLAVMQGWISKYPDDPAFQNPEALALLEDLVAQGRLGKKTGRGFYKWEGNKCVGL